MHGLQPDATDAPKYTFTYSIEDNAGATGQAPAAWHEAWRLQLSRGASATPVVDHDQLFVASLDRNVHIVALTGDKPGVVWNSNFKGGFASAPVVEDREIILGEMIRGGRLVVLDRASRREIWSAAAGDLMARPVELACQSAFGQGHTYGIGDALT